MDPPRHTALLSEHLEVSPDLEESSEAFSESTSSSGDSTSNDSRDEEISTGSDEGDEENASSSDMPDRKRAKLDTAPTDLKSRLSAFLPELQQANADLEDAGNALVSRIDDVADDEEHYIEMNLGLGVLKEVPAGDNTVTVEDSSESDADDTADMDSPEDDDAMGRLRGEKVARSTKRKVQELS